MDCGADRNCSALRRIGTTHSVKQGVRGVYGRSRVLCPADAAKEQADGLVANELVHDSVVPEDCL
jgi:hypothetical protein